MGRRLTCVARGVAKADSSCWVSTASLMSRKSKGGREASGEGPTFSSSWYLNGGLERGCKTRVSLPWGRLADALKTCLSFTYPHTERQVAT